MADRPRESAARDAGWQRYDSTYHAPVLCKDVVEGLLTSLAGVYVDGTLGGGGHTAALLDHLGPEGRVIGVDRDPDAIRYVSERHGEDIKSGRLAVRQAAFSALPDVLAEAGTPRVDGLLLDLGVSSHQLDDAPRGFSYRGSAALDMRMNPSSGATAADVVNELDQRDLSRLFRRYADERSAPKIAREIVAARPLVSTGDLVAAVERAVGRHADFSRLSRVFQAIRIEVNDELGQLEQLLLDAESLIHPGGRMAVIAYHSLEDRMVKRVFRTGNLEGRSVRDAYGNQLSPWQPLTRRPIMVAEEEIERNPRSRSARLRIAERVVRPADL